MRNRNKYIGGSDAAAVLGLSRWTTPLRVWSEKTGRIQEQDISKKLSVKLGKKLEDTVAELFMEQTGKKVRRCNRDLFHKKYPFIAGHIDRDIVGERAFLECKTTSGWAAKEWSGEDIPQEYIIQCVHYLAITDYEKFYIAVLIGNQELKIKEVARDDELVNSLIKREVEFWKEYVEKDIMPMTISADDSETLYQLYPVSDPASDLQLNGDADSLIEQIQSAAQDKISLEKTIEENKNRLKAMLGDNERGRTNLWRVSWKNQKGSTYTVNRKPTRVLRYTRIESEE